ncbi:hypothetical protein ACFQDF_05235 [Ectobacillus funiculus]
MLINGFGYLRGNPTEEVMILCCRSQGLEEGLATPKKGIGIRTYFTLRV